MVTSLALFTWIAAPATAQKQRTAPVPVADPSRYEVGTFAPLVNQRAENVAPGPCEGGGWDRLSQIEGVETQGLAVTDDGILFLAGTVQISSTETRLVTYRSVDDGTTWELVDSFPQEGLGGSHALHVSSDGSIFVLGWENVNGISNVILRRSIAGGSVGTWALAGSSDWDAAVPGAITSDENGVVFVAVSSTVPGQVGWRLDSSLGGGGPWLVEDAYEINDVNISSALPTDIAVDSAGMALVSGQLNGTPDLWVVRQGDLATGEWNSIDVFEYSQETYGLAATSVNVVEDLASGVPIVVVSGYGVPGGESSDYRWIVRRSKIDGNGRVTEPWDTGEFQLEPGQSSFANDSAPLHAKGGLLVAGTGTGEEGLSLVVRRAYSSGSGFHTILAYPGVTSPWSARLTVGVDDRAYVAAAMGTTSVVLACQMSEPRSLAH